MIYNDIVTDIFTEVLRCPRLCCSVRRRAPGAAERRSSYSSTKRPLDVLYAVLPQVDHQPKIVVMLLALLETPVFHKLWPLIHVAQEHLRLEAFKVLYLAEEVSGGFKPPFDLTALCLEPV